MSIPKIDKNYETILYLIDKLNSTYKELNRPVGKTILQKFIYLLSRERIIKYEFNMYYYGPYSEKVDLDLEYLKDLRYITIDKNYDVGYNIRIDEKVRENLKLKALSKEQKAKVDSLVKNFKEFNAKRLSVIAAAYFIKDKSDKEGDELISDVHFVKPQFSRHDIKKMLEDVKII